ncbi:MAG: sigma-70 family RNA polymerase sigma factor [Chloroflexi bacterium]|nr:MAG: sigma-70 family RNA polymerase sigma factor [Chloroflexota bacterium]
MVSGATNDAWRTWLMTGVRRDRVDRRRMRGAHKGLKKILLEGVGNGDDRPHAWKDFSGAMIRHAVDEAIHSLPHEDNQVVKLAYFGGYSNREIATEVGMTEGTVQRRLRRALSAISEQVQHGRTQARRALYALTIGLSSRWLQDSVHHAVQVAVVASATLIIVAQPHLDSRAAPVGPALSHPSVTAPVVPPEPSPTVPVDRGRVPVPPVQAPVQQPAVSLPINVPVKVPSLPPLPDKVKPPAL